MKHISALSLICTLAPLLGAADGPNELAKPIVSDEKVRLTGQLKRWHKVTLTLDGPFAHELDNDPNPFLDYRMRVEFAHQSGTPRYIVPGYFAADGNAANTSAQAGVKWRAHLSPDKPGDWSYRVSFVKGHRVAVDAEKKGEML